MDNGEIEISNQDVFSGLPDGEQAPSSCSMESFFDEILKDSHASCTHTHTCNPPGPDLSHTHTCFHVHTKILSAPAADGATADSPDKGGATSKKRPCGGNREAVRKYREKKKAWAASLEDEIAQLREVNRQLMKRLQGQASLEAEVMRLRCLLVDIRGRIEGEIGSFPYQKPAKGGGDFVPGPAVAQVNLPGGAQFLNSCDFRCNDQVYCLHPGMQGKGEEDDGEQVEQGFGVCDVGTVQCLGGSSSASKDLFNCGQGNVLSTGCVTNASRKKGGARAARDC